MTGPGGQEPGLCAQATGGLLVTGASGYLGGVLAVRAAAAGWPVTGTCLTAVAGPGLVRLDVRDRDAVLAVLRRDRPAAVVHAAAAYGDWATTADGSAHLALAARAVGAQPAGTRVQRRAAGLADPYANRPRAAPVYAYGAARRRPRPPCAGSSREPSWCARR